MTPGRGKAAGTCPISLAGWRQAGLLVSGCEAVSRWRAFSGKAAEPPEAVPGQGQGEVDRGLGQLEAPEAAGGLVGDGLPDAVAGQAATEGDRARRRPLLAGGLVRARARAGAFYRCAGGRGGADWLPGGVDGSAGQEPGAGLAGDAQGEQREDRAARAGL